MFSLADPGSMNPGTTPIELIELVAHELQWQELRALAQKRIDEVFRGDTALAAGDVAIRVANAFETNWEDREFYEHYQ